jgi:hypothetical protein
MKTTTAEILHRQLVLPVRAARVGLIAAGGESAAFAARTDVAPALTAAADRVAAKRHRVERATAKMERKAVARPPHPSAVAERRKAMAEALALVESVHKDLNTAIQALDR